MSIIYCEKHDLRWDSDFLEECPQCSDDREEEFPSKETDEKLDDPRHGQADHINRENRVGRWKR